MALKSLGLDVATYYASEVDDCAVKCSKRNHPEIVQVGDVRNITEEVRPSGFTNRGRKVDLFV